MDLNDLRYPIGKFSKPITWYSETIHKWSQEIESLPDQLQAMVSEMNEDQLASPYRPEGWTGAQVIHHIADSHMNSFIRFKLALTEQTPTIKPYNENAWSKLSDHRLPIDKSIALIESLHAKWIHLLSGMEQVDFDKDYTHPENSQIWTLGQTLALYAWHGRHHLGHLQIIKEKA